MNAGDLTRRLCLLWLERNGRWAVERTYLTRREAKRAGRRAVRKKRATRWRVGRAQ